MEPTIWAKLVGFVKESYLYRIKETFVGVIMGFDISRHLLFSGWIATLVSTWWWLIKAVGSLLLAFVTSMLTSYGSVLVKRWTDPEKKSKKDDQRKSKKAA